MTQQLSSEIIWKTLNKELFAVLGVVSSKGEARTVGIVYIVNNHKLYISTEKKAWKTRHAKNNPQVSITVPIAKQIPFMPWIKIPQATITFSGIARVYDAENCDKGILHALFHGFESDSEKMAELAVLEIEPKGDFVTYGIGIPLMQMRFPDKARGRASTN